MMSLDIIAISRNCYVYICIDRDAKNIFNEITNDLRNPRRDPSVLSANAGIILLHYIGVSSHMLYDPLYALLTPLSRCWDFVSAN